MSVNTDLLGQKGSGGTPARSRRDHLVKSAKNIKADKWRSNQSHVHDPGGSSAPHSPIKDYVEDDEAPWNIPTTTDLARSFLEGESRDTKANLQHSVSYSQQLAESQISNESGDNVSALGVGNNILLPVFLADFLKGVGDRIELEIQDVEIDFIFKIDRSSDSLSSNDVSDRSDVVTIRLTIHTISVKGAATLAKSAEKSQNKHAQPLSTQEARQVTLSDVGAMVISDTSLFADLARSTVQFSPQSPQSPTSAKCRTSTARASNMSESTGSGQVTSGPNANSMMQRQISASSSANDEGFQKFPVAKESNNQSRRRYRYSDSEIDEHDHCSVGSLHVSEERKLTPHQKSGLLPHCLSYNDTVDNPDLSDIPMRLGNQNAEQDLLYDMESPASRGIFALTSDREKTIKTFDRSSTKTQRNVESRQDTTLSEGSSLRNSDPISEGSSPESEDLVQSKLFTHEEASMYMSAISNKSNGKGENRSNPGTRDSSDLDNEGADDTAASIQQYLATNPGADISGKQRHVPIHKANLGTFDEELAEQDFETFPLPRAGETVMPPSTTKSESHIEPPQREMASSQEFEESSGTLKDSLTLAKRILTIDTVTLLFPVSPPTVQPTDPASGQQRQSTSPKMPGAFGQASVLDSANRFTKTSVPSEVHENQPAHQLYKIDMGNIEILGDTGLSRLIILILQQSNVLHLFHTFETSKDKASTPPTSKAYDLNLTIKGISWKFVDVVEGNPLLKPSQESPGISTGTDFRRSEILLRANVDDLCATLIKTKSSSTTKVFVGKFSFGYGSDDIISFNSGLKLRESTHDILAPTNENILMTITQGNGPISIDITTLPLHIALDLQRLDETFGWFGGFSSILGLGNSMVSTITIVDAKSRGARSEKPMRGVRFQSPNPTTPSESRLAQTNNRVTARIGGLIIDLQGAQSSLRLESTAIKIISRVEGLGMQVDRLNITGPYTKQSPSQSSLAVRVTSLRVEFLSTPKEVDLARLLALLSPSNDKAARDDDILLDTLLRQRRQGAVVRATIESCEGSISNLQDLHYLPLLAEDLRKLSTVAKYLPEDDRPGMLMLGLIRKLQFAVTVNGKFGVASLQCQKIEAAYITFPDLMALGIDAINLHRDDKEELVGAALATTSDNAIQLPALMIRFIGNEMEPTLKIKLRNMRFEYHISTALAIIDLDDAHSTEAVIAGMVNSVTTTTDRPVPNLASPRFLSYASDTGDNANAGGKVLKLDVALRDTIIGLNPRNLSAKGLVVLTDTHFVCAVPGEQKTTALLEIKKASIMIIDDIGNLTPSIDTRTSGTAIGNANESSQLESLLDIGWVSIGLVSSAKATIQVNDVKGGRSKAVDVDIRDDLMVLESCADSTQTLLSILNGLKPPMPPSTELKYMTEVVPIEDMLASLTGDTFVTARGGVEHPEIPLAMDEGDMVDDEVPQNLEFVSSFYNPEPDAAYDTIADSMLDDELESLASPSLVREIGDKNLLESFEGQAQVAPGNEPLMFQEDHFGANLKSRSKSLGRNIEQESHGSYNSHELQDIPLKIRVRDVHIIWNLFDGYDWQRTRDVISQAVEDVQNQAAERLSRADKRKSIDTDEEEDSVIGDFLFNSIYIGIPANRDPRELTRRVNRNIDDLVSESESRTTSTPSASPSRQGYGPYPRRKLRLKRSRYHKMTFELKGVSADVVVLPPDSGELQSSVDVQVRDLEIFDHVPTSTWKKFATYMHDAGERQSGTSMVHLEIFNVRPVPKLAASEIILKVSSCEIL